MAKIRGCIREGGLCWEGPLREGPLYLMRIELFGGRGVPLSKGLLYYYLVTYLPHGGIQRHLSLPDLVKLGLAGRMLHKIHHAPIVGPRQESRVAPCPQLSRQQLVGLGLVLLITLVQHTDRQLLKFPMKGKPKFNSRQWINTCSNFKLKLGSSQDFIIIFLTRKGCFLCHTPPKWFFTLYHSTLYSGSSPFCLSPKDTSKCGLNYLAEGVSQLENYYMYYWTCVWNGTNKFGATDHVYFFLV